MRIFSFSFLLCYHLVIYAAAAQDTDRLSALQIMGQVKNNLKMEKSVYEEVSAILTDQSGQTDTRQLRKFTRISDDGAIKFLMVFDAPEEYEGVAILVEQVMQSAPEVYVYLPASGELLKHLNLWDDNEGLFGMDFSLGQISDLFNESFQYVRREDRKIGEVNYFMIDAYQMDIDVNNAVPVLTHQILQEGMFVTRTNYYDGDGKIIKQLSMHELNKNSSNWSARMLYMMDRNKLHSTLIKINKRVISSSIVTNDVFTADWLLENKPPLDISPSEEDQLESELIDASINHNDDSVVINTQVGER